MRTGYNSTPRMCGRRCAWSGRSTEGPKAQGRTGLLTFATPTTARTELPAGTTRTDLLVFYDAGIDAASLRARLNGREASTLFHPYPAWREVAGIPLTPV